jgi:Ca2+-binding RTX toxin-like protein
MASTSELQEIKNENPALSIPGLDTTLGLQVAETSLKSPQMLTGIPGVYYNSSQHIVVVYQNGVTLSGFDLTGLSVMVQASNVTISNCAFDATSGTYAVKIYPGYANAVVDHCAFDGLKLDRGFQDFIVAQGANTTITNSTFVNAPADGIYIESGTIAHNVITGGGYLTGAHPDAIWIGKTTGPVTISDNVIDWRNPADSRAETNNAIRVTGENGNVNDVTVTHNVILGGSTTVFVSDGPTQTHSTVGTVTNVEVSGNVVDSGRWGYLNLTDRPDDLVYADNVLATGPSPAIANGANPQIATLNHITGSAVADSLSGSSLADFIVGGAGGDWLTGNAGNDVILSGAGRDYVTGGSGTDYFMYTSVAETGIGASSDLITDFKVGIDKIYLAGLQGLPALAADDHWHFVGTKYFTGAALEIRTYASGSNTIVAFDLDGDMKADMAIDLSGSLSLTASDFLFTATTPDTAEAASFSAATPVATMTGTAGGNVLNGTAAGETIHGLAGGDVINGGGGDDVIVGGTGKDMLTGGTGHDRFVFEVAADSTLGGSYRDVIQDFTHGQDVIDVSAIDAKVGTAAHDAFSWIGTSNFSGVAGQLRYQVIGAYTVVSGDTNGDKVADFEIGLAGNLALVSSDVLFGAPLPAAAALMGWSSVAAAPNTSPLNNITGSSAVDYLKGSTGADYISGGQGNDWISAGAGNDIIQGGVGRDYLTGGAGADTFSFTNVNELGDLITDFAAGQDKISLANLAGLPAAAQGASWSWIGTGAYSGHALELRYAQSGGSTFVTADLDGDKKTDIQLELSGQISLKSSDFVVATNGTAATSSVIAQGTTSPNAVTGTSGADTLNGTAAADSITGGAGNDKINGGAGDDLIWGGLGTDTLTGGTGQDHFVFAAKSDSAPGSARDVITDFTQSEDVIDLSQLDAIAASAAHDAFSWIGQSAFSGAAGQLRASAYSYGTVVQGDINGDKVVDFEILLSKSLELTSHDFLL